MKLEQALSILGSDFDNFKIDGNCAHSPNNSICFRYSKMYDKAVWWTSEYFDRADSSDFVVIAIQDRGILVIPSYTIKEYWHTLNMVTLAKGRIKIRIKEENGRIVLYNNKTHPTFDVTEFLH